MEQNIKTDFFVNGFNLTKCNSIYEVAKIQLNEKQLCAQSEDGRNSCNAVRGSPLIGDLMFFKIFLIYFLILFYIKICKCI